MLPHRLDPSPTATSSPFGTGPSARRHWFVSSPHNGGGQALMETEPIRPAFRPGVLVVDDEELVRSVLEMGLTRSGFTAWVAKSGEEAVEQYRAHRDEIALVLLDVRMPGMNGLQTLIALQAINPAVKVCFLTGCTGELSEADLLAHGALRVRYKPFRLSELLGELWELVWDR